VGIINEVDMSIGYACLTMGVPNTSIKRCMLKNVNEQKLEDLIEHNLKSLENMIDYNLNNEIKLFRISSDIIPFGSSEANTVLWHDLFNSQFHTIAEKIKTGGIRVSMHPGQYTVLNSSDSNVVKKAIDDLQYHADFLDSIETDYTNKIVLHVGGVYGDKEMAIKRFAKHLGYLNDSIKKRLVIENDDRSYSICDVLELGRKYNIPVVYDNLHNSVNCCDVSKDDCYWIMECANTWNKGDGKQKIHYSQQDESKKVGSHSPSIMINEFLGFYNNLGDDKPDIMLEVKDKNLSAIKCMNCIAERKKPKALEVEWSRYKYAVLEHSPNDYVKVRNLLKDKKAYPAIEFYNIVENALNVCPSKGNSINAALHIWGYFREVAEEREKKAFFKNIEAFNEGLKPLSAIKKFLWKMAEKHNNEYLLSCYYFNKGF